MRGGKRAPLRVDRDALHGFEAVDQAVLHAEHFCFDLCVFLPVHFRSQPHTGDARNILGAGTAVLLLPASVDQRI